MHRRADTPNAFNPRQDPCASTARALEAFVDRIMEDAAAALPMEELGVLMDALVHATHEDPLTGLPNGAVFHTELQRALMQCKVDRDRTVALLLVDADRISDINEGLGHQAGDDLLREVADRLRRVVPMQGVLARMGGARFGILLRDIPGPEVTVELCRRIQEALVRPVRAGGSTFRTTVTMGLALGGQSTSSDSALYRDAATALAHARRRRRGSWMLFDPAMQASAIERLAVECDLRATLDRGGSELRVFAQPLVDLEAGEPVGFEALVRWEHPSRGLLSPGTFVPIAEETGLVIPMGQWMLRESCAEVARWMERGHDLPVSVNVAVQQIEHGDLVADVEEALAQSGIPASLLKVEITETNLMHDIESKVSVLTTLQNLGVRIHIDDFGTGYSSLGYLAHLPVHALKIDRCFVKNLPEDHRSGQLVRAIVDLAHNLGLTVIGEGIETLDQLRELKTFGCDLGQGYLFARPMPAEKVADWLELARSAASVADPRSPEAETRPMR